MYREFPTLHLADECALKDLCLLPLISKVLSLRIPNCPGDRRLQEQVYERRWECWTASSCCTHECISIWATSGSAERSDLPPPSGGPRGALPVFLPTIDVLSRFWTQKRPQDGFSSSEHS